MAAVLAGSAYFVTVFTAGFLFGTIRVLLLVPAVGPTIAVLIELPVMMTVSWFACRWIVRRFAVPDDMNTRVAMGAIAFILLMAAEFAAAYALFGLRPQAFAAQLATLPGVIGLAGQIAFGVFPAMQRA